MESAEKWDSSYFVKSGCYMNVAHATNKMRPEFRYHFKSKTVDHAFNSDKGDGVAFNTWRFVLANPHISHVEPLEIFAMNLM